jgi:chitodextrinase
MKRLLFLCLICLIGIFPLQAKDIYVGKTGSDLNDGATPETAYLTIQKASDNAVSGDVVLISGGVYREMVDIKTDGVTFQPYNSESVSINGTDLLYSWTLTPGTTSTYQTTMNWDVDSKWGSNQIFSDGKMIELARWPDQTSEDIIMPTNAVADGATASGNSLILSDADFSEPDGIWTGAQIWINLSRNGVDGQGWTGTVTSTSSAAHTITVDFRQEPVLTTAPWGIGLNTEYFLFNPLATAVNTPEKIDALLSNGEWWKNGTTIYVKTPNGAAPSETSDGANLIEAKKRHFAFWSSTNCASYTIKGFNLFACAITTDKDPWSNREVILEAAHDILIDGITAKYVSHQTSMTQNFQDEFYYGAGIVLRGRNNTIQNCNIQYSATAALHVSGFGNKVLNNTIANTNYFCANSGALSAGFICQDAEIANNTIYNTSSIAINLSRVKNSTIAVPDVFRVHHNTIYNFMRRTGDSGAIDAAGNDFQGARIDHNIIFNTTVATGQMTHGVYLDYAGKDDLCRITVDHNVIYDIPVPVMISATRFVNVFNNVLLSDPAYNQNCVVNWGGSMQGIDDKIFNNIMSKGPGIGGTPDLSLAVISNNITNATGAVLADLFVDAANHDYHLKSTATDAIDKGMSAGVYDEDVVALTDLGAYEYGTIADNTPPTVPSGLNVNTISNNSFVINWQASTDNVQVTGYYVYLNGILFDSTVNLSKIIKNLEPSTSYNVSVKARDYYKNISAGSTSVSASTVSYPGQTLHLESENYSTKLGGSTSGGVWSGYKTNYFLQFNGITLSEQISFKAYVSCTTANTQLEVRLNTATGPLLGTLIVSPTGDIATFESQTTELTGVPLGVFTIFIVAKNTTANTSKLDWVELSGGLVVGEIPTVPQDVTTSFVGDSRFKLTWAGSIDDKAITAYEVFKDGISMGTVTGNSMLMEGLIPSTLYVISVRASDGDGNWSEQSETLVVTTNSPKLTGVILGTDGTWVNDGSDDKAKVFDGDINTFFDCTTENFAWSGLEFSTPKVITSILFYPRFNGAQRMTNGVFQGSSTADFSSDVVTFYKIPVRPTEEWQGIIISLPTAFKYIRYQSPVGGFGNIAEVEFYGVDESSWVDVTPPSEPTALTSTNITSSGVNINWTASLDNVGVVNYEVFKDGSSVGTSSTTSISVTGLTANTTYIFNVKAIDIVGNTSASSATLSVTTAFGTSISEIPDEGEVFIYPNPASSILMVKTPNKNSVITISDTDGRTISTVRVENYESDIDVSKLNKGIYLIRIQTNNEIVTRKAIIK